jgi:hypothetical protein
MKFAPYLAALAFASVACAAHAAPIALDCKVEPASGPATVRVIIDPDFNTVTYDGQTYRDGAPFAAAPDSKAFVKVSMGLIEFGYVQTTGDAQATFAYRIDRASGAITGFYLKSAGDCDLAPP